MDEEDAKGDDEMFEKYMIIFTLFQITVRYIEPTMFSCDAC